MKCYPLLTQTHKMYFRENLPSASTLSSPQCLTLLRGDKEEPRLKNRLRIMMIQQKQHSEYAVKGLHKVTDFLSNGREGGKKDDAVWRKDGWGRKVKSVWVFANVWPFFFLNRNYFRLCSRHHQRQTTPVVWLLPKANKCRGGHNVKTKGHAII